MLCNKKEENWDKVLYVIDVGPSGLAEWIIDGRWEKENNYGEFLGFDLSSWEKGETGKIEIEIALFLFIYLFLLILLHFCVCARACSEVGNLKFCFGQVNRGLHDKLDIRDVSWQLNLELLGTQRQDIRFEIH